MKVQDEGGIVVIRFNQWKGIITRIIRDGRNTPNETNQNRLNSQPNMSQRGSLIQPHQVVFFFAYLSICYFICLQNRISYKAQNISMPLFRIVTHQTHIFFYFANRKIISNPKLKCIVMLHYYVFYNLPQTSPQDDYCSI